MEPFLYISLHPFYSDVNNHKDILGPSSDPPRHREYRGGGMETIGKIRQIEVTENNFFY